MARIYAASSWRNKFHAEITDWLRENGHEVYDFKNIRPSLSVPVSTAFSWAELDERWQQWTPRQYRENLLTKQRASHGYVADLRGMEWADTCVLIMPCGRSAHIEAGFMKGRGKRVIVYFHEDVSGEGSGFEPDLMYLLCDGIAIGKTELAEFLK